LVIRSVIETDPPRYIDASILSINGSIKTKINPTIPSNRQ